jgi:hypothetical protein
VSGGVSPDTADVGDEADHNEHGPVLKAGCNNLPATSAIRTTTTNIEKSAGSASAMSVARS